MPNKDHANWIAMKPKIKAAFEHLRKAGITARMNFSITLTDGIAEIYDPKYRGYAFWHNQDHVRVREHGIVTLAFGEFAKKPKEATIVGIGREVRAVLEKQGLYVDWDDSAQGRIEVHLTKAAKAKHEKDAQAAYEARLARDAASKVGLDMDALGKKLIAAVESMTLRDLSWVDATTFADDFDDKKQKAFLKGKTRLVAWLPLKDPAITDGEFTIYLRSAKWQGKSHQQVAVRYKNALKEQGVTARVKSGMVIVKVG